MVMEGCVAGGEWLRRGCGQGRTSVKAHERKRLRVDETLRRHVNKLAYLMRNEVKATALRLK